MSTLIIVNLLKVPSYLTLKSWALVFIYASLPEDTRRRWQEKTKEQVFKKLSFFCVWSYNLKNYFPSTSVFQSSMSQRKLNKFAISWCSFIAYELIVYFLPKKVSLQSATNGKITCSLESRTLFMAAYHNISLEKLI